MKTRTSSRPATASANKASLAPARAGLTPRLARSRSSDKVKVTKDKASVNMTRSSRSKPSDSCDKKAEGMVTVKSSRRQAEKRQRLSVKEETGDLENFGQDEVQDNVEMPRKRFRKADNVLAQSDEGNIVDKKASLSSSKDQKNASPPSIDSSKLKQEASSPFSTHKMDSDSESDEDDTRNFYVKMREKNLKANEEFFASLGIENAKLQLQASLPSLHSKRAAPSNKGLKIKREPREPLPRRQSMRIQRVDPAGSPLPPLPEPTVSLSDNPYAEERLPSGPLEMKDHIFSKACNQSEDSVNAFSHDIVSAKQVEEMTCSMTTFLSGLDKVKITDDYVAKVVPGRVFSLTWHPSPSVLIAAAGDKYGHIGLWNVLSNEGEVLTFKPHIKPVSNLLIPSSTPHKLYSCSYDATLRCGDFERGVFDEVFSVPAEDDDLFRNFEFVDDMHTMLVSQFSGNVSVVDLRTPTTSAEQTFNVCRKSLRTVSVHPRDQNYFVTAGVDAIIRLWDRRSMRAKTPKPVQSLSQHSKAIFSAYFSPDTGDKILSSSSDDTIVIHSSNGGGMEYELTKRIRHNNHTGRWLTNFRPEWHPVVPDVFVTGSMARPREIEIFRADGQRIRSLKDEDCLGSVCSLNTFHPQRPCTLVGANSSGRLHVFM